MGLQEQGLMFLNLNSLKWPIEDKAMKMRKETLSLAVRLKDKGQVPD
jgi:hypothetical protein